MSTLSNAGTIIKRYYNLQVDFNKRPQYTRAKLARCTRANHFESFPDRENYFLRSTNVQPVFDIVPRPMSKTGCTFVDMGR